MMDYVTIFISLVHVLPSYEVVATADVFKLRKDDFSGDVYHELWTKWKSMYPENNYDEDLKFEAWVSNYEKVTIPSFVSLKGK